MGLSPDGAAQNKSIGRNVFRPACVSMSKDLMDSVHMSFNSGSKATFQSLTAGVTLQLI
jgi:hypothetical protein